MRKALESAASSGLLPEVAVEDVAIERPQKPDNGDFATSLPLRLAREMRTSPVKIAEALVGQISAGESFDRVWAAPPGFVNFSLNAAWLAQQVETVRAAGERYGNSTIGDGQRVQIEFVSVNPTGPLHVGHARGAVFGSALANLMEAAGYAVQREYYVNDAGNQMELFNKTLVARYKQAAGQQADIPEDGYQGDYMVELAGQLHDEFGGELEDTDDDALTSILGAAGLKRMLDRLKDDLGEIRVEYDEWFSEKSLYSGGQYDAGMAVLREGGLLTDRDGATWFKSSALGDEKDKVLIRSTGAPTYFASDVAYHYSKFVERGFDRVINVWGADHQGQVPFMRSMAVALGIEPDRLQLLLYQLVTLRRGEEVVRVSKRTGDLVTLKELVDEVGPDACRYFFLSRTPDSQMEFDLDLAKKETPENPVYYIQYAHARIASIIRLAQERGIDYADGDLSLLEQEEELALIRKMLLLPELVETMVRALEPHHLPHYAVDLATAFHSFYERHRVVSSEPADLPVTKARLRLMEATRTVLARCLRLMSMDAPETM